MTATLSADRISLTEAAAKIGVSANTVSDYLRAGKIKGARIGRRVFVDVADLERYLRGEPVTSAAEVPRAEK